MQKVKKPSKASGRLTQAGTLPVLYVVFWSFAGAASAAYLGFVITDPDLINALSSPAAPAPQSESSDEVLASPQARTLRNRLSEAQKDITQLRSELSEHKEAYAAAEASGADPAIEEATAATHEEGATNETQVAGLTAKSGTQISSEDHTQHSAADDAAPSGTQPAIAVPGVSVAGVSIAPPTITPPMVPSATPDTPALSTVSEVAIANATLVNGPVEPSNIETGALPVPPAPEPGVRPKPKPVVTVAIAKPKPPVARAAPRATPAAPPKQVVAFGTAKVTTEPAARTSAFGVRLASAPSLDALRLTWNAMRERHGETLRGLKARYVKQNPANAGAGPYTLVAGPVAKPTDVLEICAGLGGESLECALIPFEGRTL